MKGEHRIEVGAAVTTTADLRRLLRNFSVFAMGSKNTNATGNGYKYYLPIQ